MTWAVSGGTAAATNPAMTAAAASRITITAVQRGSRRRVSQFTAGSSPAAMNRARPMRTSTDRALISSSTSPYVTATPAAAAMPTKNGERRFMGRPSRPSPPVSSAIAAAASTARCIWSGGSGARSPAAGRGPVAPGVFADEIPGRAVGRTLLTQRVVADEGRFAGAAARLVRVAGGARTWLAQVAALHVAHPPEGTAGRPGVGWGRQGQWGSRPPRGDPFTHGRAGQRLAAGRRPGGRTVTRCRSLPMTRRVGWRSGRLAP